MKKDYQFETTCVASTGELINEMTEQAVETTYETMLKHCEGLLDVAFELGYERSRRQGHGLTLKHDWAVSY